MAKPILWTSSEVTKAVNGKNKIDWYARGVSIDSRTIQPDDLFIAIEGPNFNGHDFVVHALSQGAIAAIVSHPPLNVDVNVDTDMPLVLVKDTFTALNNLGHTARKRSKARFCAITGSVGKTIVKEALKFVLSYQGRTAATFGNYNNHWGVPLTLARLPRDVIYGVIEMGMNHAGELTPLSKLVKPHVTVITTVDLVHSEHFKSIKQIADAKAEVFSGIEPGGTVVINRDNFYYERLASTARATGISNIINFGNHAKADARILHIHPLTNGWQVKIDILGQIITFSVPLPGQHGVINATCVLAAAAALEADVIQAAHYLSKLQTPQGRGKIHLIHLNNGSLRLIDESYNASPVSMRAAIDTLAHLKPEKGGRRIAVLGDMLELGKDGPIHHTALAEDLIKANIKQVFLVGKQMHSLHEILSPIMHSQYFSNVKSMAKIVANSLKVGDLLMVKGSRGMHTDLVVKAVMALDNKKRGV